METEPLNNGLKNEYAAGLFVKKIKGWDNISHSGSTAGYRANLETYPELKLTIAILSNNSQFSVPGLSTKISDILVIDKSANIITTQSPEPKITNFKYSAQELKVYEGKYFSEETNSSVSITLKDDTLFIRLNTNTIFPLESMSKDTFQNKEMGAIFNFNKNKKGKVYIFKVSVSRAKNVVYERLN